MTIDSATSLHLVYYLTVVDFYKLYSLFSYLLTSFATSTAELESREIKPVAECGVAP